jgi:hypothetical protein
MFTVLKARNDLLFKHARLIQDSFKLNSSLSQSDIAASTQIKNNNYKTIDDIPGPKIYPLIGNLLELKPFGIKI